MKDYRPLLSDVAILIAEVTDYLDRSLQDDGLDTSFSREELQYMEERVTEMFNELDYELEGAEVF